MKIKKEISNLFKYNPKENYNYELSQTQTTNNINQSKKTSKKVTNNISENRTYLSTKYNALINSDIVLRNLNINLKGKQYSSFIFYIDGMVNSDMVNNYLLKPLMLKNTTNSSLKKDPIITSNNDLKIRKENNSNLETIIYNSLIPQNSVKITDNFDEIISFINAGFTALFIDSISKCFCIEAKGYKTRSISSPKNEIVIRGSQESFVEDIRTNTSILRRIINNENLVIEQIEVGQLNKTKIGICYMSNITNEDLIDEVKYRINNLKIDSITSAGQLEHLIQDNDNTIFPQIIMTERTDRACNNILEGRIVILINGAPVSLIVPTIFIDFLSSPEDSNLKYQYTNLIRFIRSIAFLIAVLLPGIYASITSYHQELIPSNLVFAIAASRQGIPFPIFFEILIMEISFELLREASLRIPSPMGSTIGIIGGLILGEAAVSASLVSPLLIIIIAITGISSFAIPDFSLGFALRIFRFLFLILGYISGFLGICFGIYIELLILSNLKSFGVSYFSPYAPVGNKNTINKFYMNPIWKRNKRSDFLNTKKPNSEEHISMFWKK